MQSSIAQKIINIPVKDDISEKKDIKEPYQYKPSGNVPLQRAKTISESKAVS